MQHNNKIQELSLKLLTKQKKPKNPFDVTRTITPPSTKEIKPGVDEV